MALIASTCRPVFAAALSILLVGSVGAQDSMTPPLLPEGEAPDATGDPMRNPHEMLDVLHGGPDGSPTARRGNPRPGTSTSIPTMHPAPVRPLEVREGEAVMVEDTGIDWQCDPVVRIGICPALDPAAADPGIMEPTAPEALEDTGAEAAMESEAGE